MADHAMARPAGHAVQLLASDMPIASEKVPAGQLSQSEEEPTAAEKVPVLCHSIQVAVWTHVHES